MADEALKQEVHREWEAAAAGYAKWDEVLAAAILDRMLHHSHMILIQGES